MKTRRKGGRIDVDCTLSQGEYYMIEDKTSLTSLYSKDSIVEITLAPNGPLIDGSQGQTLVRSFALGAIWRDRYLRGIPFGVYSTTARITEPDGAAHPLRLSLTRVKSASWKPSVQIEFPPTNLFPDGSSAVSLFLGQ